MILTYCDELLATTKVGYCKYEQQRWCFQEELAMQ